MHTGIKISLWIISLSKVVHHAFHLSQGIKDFLPTHTQDSHENFTLVMDRAARWAAEQTDISLSNMQAVFIKKKGTDYRKIADDCAGSMK